MIVVNLFGSPGTGKSTTATGVFSKLKLLGYNCEYVSEFDKTMTWHERQAELGDQVFVFGVQNHYLEMLRNKVEFVILDSPLLLNMIYGNRMHSKLDDLVLQVANSYDNINFYLKRVKPYNPIGRNETEAQSTELGDKIKNILNSTNTEYVEIDADESVIDYIVESITKKDQKMTDFNKEDVVKVARAIIFESVYYDDGDYRNYDYRCKYCDAGWNGKEEDFKHD